MECMNVDGVPVAGTLPPRSPGRKRNTSTTDFLSLPWKVKWHVYMHLPSRDCIALSRTCRQMYGFNAFAYTHLQFLPPISLFSLARSVYQLAEVLACSPRYAEAVRTIRIVGWDTVDIPEGCDHETVYKALDEGITTLLKHAPHVYSLTLDLNPTKAINYFPKTFTTLIRVRTIRDLRLATFLVPTYTAETSPLREYVPGEAPPAYERVCLDVGSGEWLPLVMHDPRNLRWFGFSILDKAWKPGDTNWAMTLRHIAETATKLETLVLNNGRHFDAGVLGQILQFGFDRGILRKLRSFSISTNALSFPGLRQLFCDFSRSSVTHLRIIVNHNGTWLRDFGPQYISELARLVPDLEEISLDQSGMIDAAPLPGHMGAWGEAFRTFKKLRRIVFASMFVFDICRPRPVDDDEEEDGEEDGEIGRDEDADMDVDDNDDSGDEGYESDDGNIDDASHGEEDTLEPNLFHLAAWTDKFLDDHLRMPAPLAEIWFLDSRFPAQTVAGFNQRVVEGSGEGGRTEYLIYHPVQSRDGWWWDEYEPIPLD